MRRGAALAIVLLVVSAAALAQFKDDGTLDPPPSRSESIYPTDAKKELARALAEARKQHKRVILDFGGDWCYDCHVLEYAFASDRAIHSTLEANYVLGHIDVGEMDRNLEIAKKYKMNLAKGVPALAVLDANGKLLYSDPGGFFEHARGMTKRDIVAFLDHWAPKK
jgi:thiol:disulfide interchange protein